MSRLGRLPAAADNSATSAYSLCKGVAEAGPGALVDERRHERERSVGRTDHEARNCLGEPGAKRLQRRTDDNDAAAGAALLSRIAECGLDDARDGFVEVRVVVDHDRVLAAHLEDDLLHVALALADHRCG